MRKIILFFSIFIIILTLNCSSLIRDEDIPVILDMEKYTYLMNKDVEIGGKSLKKDQEVKIIVSYTDDWIKIEAYNSGEDKLKAERVRLIYLFEDDFKDDTFDFKIYQKKILAIIRKK